jgi:hypothetical protein
MSGGIFPRGMTSRSEAQYFMGFQDELRLGYGT